MQKVSFFFWKKKRYIEFPITILDWFNCLIISHPSVKFESDRSRESKFITIFICHVTLYDHVINRLCNLIDDRLALTPSTLSNLVTIGPAEVEIKRFPFALWWLVHVIKASKDCMDGGPLLKTSTLSILSVIALVEVEIYRFLLVTWLHVATWTKGQVCQVWWPCVFWFKS